MKKILLALFTAGFVFGVTVAPALALGRPLPDVFWGNLTVGGSPAVAGTTIEARGAGVITGILGNPVTTTEVGKYGGPGAALGVLAVQGDNITDGATVTFFVNGVQAAQTAQWHAGDTTNLNLTAAAAPGLAVGTGAASNVAATAVTLSGSLTQLTGAASATVGFQWGPDTNYGSETPGQTLGAPGGFTADLTGLLSNTTYHYRAKATAGPTTVFGGDQAFTTGIVTQLGATTGSAANVGATTATLSGSLSLAGAASATVSFQWGLTTASPQTYGAETPSQTMTSTGPFTASLTGLLANTTYHYRAKAVAGQATVFGNDRTFATAQAGGGGTGGGGTGGGGTGGGGSDSGGVGGTSGPPVTVTTTGLKGEVDLKVDDSGKSQSQVKLTSTNEGPKHSVEIAANTTMKGKDGAPLTSITMAAPATAPPAPSQGKVVLTQDLGPNGATFDPPITVTLAFDPAALGAGVKPTDLTMGFFDGSQWVTLDATLDPVNNALSAKVSHFTVFGVLTKPAAAAPPPTSSAPTPAAPAPSPTPSASPAPSTSPTAPPSAAPSTSPAAGPASPSAPAQPTVSWLRGAMAGGAVILIAALAVLLLRRRASAG